MPRKTGLARVSFLTAAAGLAVVSAGDDIPQNATQRAPIYADHAQLMVVKDGNGRSIPVQKRADWEVRRDHIVAHFQEVAGILPGGERRVPLETRVVTEIKERQYVRKKIVFATEPGDRVPAWLLVPEPADATRPLRPAILCLHQTIAIGKDEPAGLGQNLELAYAAELAERGFVTLAPDYPNFGEYKVDVYKMGYASATMKAIWNNLRAIDLLCSLPEVDPERIGVIGHSLGGHNAIFTALFDQRIKCVISSCGFNAFSNYFHGNISGWSHDGYMPRLRKVYQLDLANVPFDFPELVAAIAPRAFFANSPLRDANFDVDGVRVCFAAARPIYELYGALDHLVAVYPDAAHAFPRAQRLAAYDFLDRVLVKKR
jgi:dienelactone hydrolase